MIRTFENTKIFALVSIDSIEFDDVKKRLVICTIEGKKSKKHKYPYADLKDYDVLRKSFVDVENRDDGLVEYD